MKKKGIKLAACTLVLAMALSLGACSVSSDDKDSDKKTTAENSDTNNDDADDNASSAMFESMEEYIASDEAQAEVDALKASMQGDEMSVDVRGEGNKLIYTFKYDTLVKEEGMEEAFESESAKVESMFTQAAKLMKSVVAVDNPVVVVEYIDANGEMIFTKDYGAE